MAGRKSRNKGMGWERECAHALSTAIGDRVERSLEETRSGNSGDLVLPEQIPLTVQCKVGHRPPIYRAMAQAVAAAPQNHVPVAIIRRNGAGRRPPDDLVVMRFSDFLDWVQERWGKHGRDPASEAR